MEAMDPAAASGSAAMKERRRKVVLLKEDLEVRRVAGVLRYSLYQVESITGTRHRR
jgi:hypothetical protein